MPHWLVKVGGALRDGWLILGIALAIFFAAEAAVRIGVRATSSPPEAGSTRLGHPYHGQAWYPIYWAAAEHLKTVAHPYLSTRLEPVASRYVNVDSSGFRVTPQPRHGAAALRVVMLGGSALWGIGARDSATIPALLVRALAARGLPDVEVANLGTPGHNATQEAIALERELAWGRRVDAAVTYDGYNDAASALANRHPGKTYSEDYIRGLLERSTRGFAGTIAGLGRFSVLVTRLRRVGRDDAPRPMGDVAALCGATGAYYANVHGTIQALARGRGFVALAFHQPFTAASRKAFTPWERAIASDRRVAVCSDSMVERMRPEAGRTYFDLRAAFDHDSATVFLDDRSHVTEAANATLAGLIADQLAPRLRDRRRAP